MPRTQEELEEAAADFEHWVDELDPAVLDDPASRADDLRAITSARDVIAMGERQLAMAVAAARANGRSWGEIGLFLGVTKQAARKRFGEPGTIQYQWNEQTTGGRLASPAKSSRGTSATGPSSRATGATGPSLVPKRDGVPKT